MTKYWTRDFGEDYLRFWSVTKVSILLLRIITAIGVPSTWKYASSRRRLWTGYKQYYWKLYYSRSVFFFSTDTDLPLFNIFLQWFYHCNVTVGLSIILKRRPPNTCHRYFIGFEWYDYWVLRYRGRCSYSCTSNLSIYTHRPMN